MHAQGSLLFYETLGHIFFTSFSMEAIDGHLDLQAGISRYQLCLPLSLIPVPFQKWL